MTPLLFEQSQKIQLALEVTGTSASALAKPIEATDTPGSSLATMTALAMLLIGLNHTGPVIATMPDRRYLAAHTLGSEAEIRCLRVTEVDLFSQLNRVYDHLHKEQVDLDADIRRIVYGSLWDLYT